MNLAEKIYNSIRVCACGCGEKLPPQNKIIKVIRIWFIKILLKQGMSEKQIVKVINRKRKKLI